MPHLWTISEDSFDPRTLHHKETIFSLGNGYLSTRGAFEESYPGERRATFLHGVFDAAPIVFTELANAPDWLPFSVYLNGERFALDRGHIEAYRRVLDLCRGVLTRTVRWRSPSGDTATIAFERFAALSDPHRLLIRCRVTPEFTGTLEFRAALNGNVHNDGLLHWNWLDQGARDGVAYLHSRTRVSWIEIAYAMRLEVTAGRAPAREIWDVENRPTICVKLDAAPGQDVVLDKHVAVYTSRDPEATHPVEAALSCAREHINWETASKTHTDAWAQEWARTDVRIEGDDEAQLAIRFNLFHMLIAAPRHDDRVNIGAKTLSGFGYRGHAFWDTEIFMLPLFTYTAPHIARNLLTYRYRCLPAARRKAQSNGFQGAQFAWESADTGEEVTPTWVPRFGDPGDLVRIWTGDIEIHISADIAYAVYQYWQATGDDQWFVDKGAELILDTAKFWASRAEWNASAGRYEYNDVIGPDEYHEHVNNNAYTNCMAQWNLDTALHALDWLQAHAPARWRELIEQLDLSETRLAHWRDVVEKLQALRQPSGLIEQFEGYFKLEDVDLASLEPRTRSIQEVYGIEGANLIQAIKQPDVLMLLYLLRKHYGDGVVHANYDYYSPRTDHSYGSSLGPAIMAIIACEVGQLDDAYAHFIRAARADLRDVRGNAGDGIHAASAAGLWQAVVFGFGGLRITADGWTVQSRLPEHWKRLAFKFFYRGVLHEVDVGV